MVEVLSLQLYVYVVLWRAAQTRAFTSVCLCFRVRHDVAVCGLTDQMNSSIVHVDVPQDVFNALGRYTTTSDI